MSMSSKENDKSEPSPSITLSGGKKKGTTYIKRFAVTGVVRDREYDVTQERQTHVSLISAPTRTEKPEIIKVTLKAEPTRKTHYLFERDFQRNQHQRTSGM